MQGQMMSMGASVAIAFAIALTRHFNKFKGENEEKMNEAFLKEDVAP